MKVTIDLSLAEVRGITAYLKATSPEINPKVSKHEISEFVKGIVNGELQAPHCAVADYVRQAEKELESKGFIKLGSMPGEE